MPSLNEVILKPPTLVDKSIIWRVCLNSRFSDSSSRDSDSVGLEWYPDDADAVGQRPHFKEILLLLTFPVLLRETRC